MLRSGSDSSSPVQELVEYLDFIPLSSKVALSFDFT